MTENLAGQSRTTTNTYDELSRSTSEVTSAGAGGTSIINSSYQYDGVGNRKLMTSNLPGGPVTTNYTYDAADRLAGSSLSTGGSYTYNYDNNDSLTSEQYTDGLSGSTSYGFDVQNRLISW